MAEIEDSAGVPEAAHLTASGSGGFGAARKRGGGAGSEWHAARRQLTNTLMMR